MVCMGELFCTFQKKKLVSCTLFLDRFWKTKPSKSSSWKTKDWQDSVGGEVIGSVGGEVIGGIFTHPWVVAKVVCPRIALAGLLFTHPKFRKAEQTSEPVFSKSFGFFCTLFFSTILNFWRQSLAATSCKNKFALCLGSSWLGRRWHHRWYFYPS